MKNALPLIIVLVVVVGLLFFTGRAKRRQAAATAQRAAEIGVGTEVMTTSGLYGTVVARNADDSVQLSVAPGVEVRWAVPALRPVDSLPNRPEQGTIPGAAEPPVGPSTVPLSKGGAADPGPGTSANAGTDPADIPAELPPTDHAGTDPAAKPRDERAD